jgi:Fic-DOC domain mobile mystery protein B
VTREGAGARRFSLQTIGPDPTGATPIEPENLDGLIPVFVATRADLNQVEFENISQALTWAQREAGRRGPIEILDYGFLFELHKRMFGDVWKWAGTQRRRETSIGVAPGQIVTQTRAALDDARYWHEHETFVLDERAARVHFRLVSVHPFPNGNGRCTRLLSDLYIEACGGLPFTWGRSRLTALDETRRIYIGALETAHSGDLGPLVSFARS